MPAGLAGRGEGWAPYRRKTLIVQPAEQIGLLDLTPLGNHARQIDTVTGPVGQRVWLAVEERTAWGYARTIPVPGLPELRDLELFVAPSRRRQGIGTLLWTQVRLGLAGEECIRRVSATINDEQEPFVRFLAHHAFYREHVEWEMRCVLAGNLPEPAWPPGYEPQTYPRVAAIRRFIDLYDESFEATPWYQPFSENEVEESLDRANDLQFVIAAGKPVAVAWVRRDGTTGVIEPIGVVPAHQGKGVGRALLTSIMIALHRRGVTMARLGVWQQNRAAIALYRHLGFQRRRRTIFLAYDLD
jgi:ribosomal protein S18 acetylase RimI-like enzyme